MPKSKQFKLPESLAEHWMTKLEVQEALKMSSYSVDRLIDDEYLVRGDDKYNGYVIVSRASVEAYLSRYVPA